MNARISPPRAARRTTSARALALALSLAALLLPLAPGCAAVGSPSASGMTETRLYLGTRIGRDREVSAAEWEKFLADSIVRRFPDGLSIQEATGFWRDAGGVIVRERTHVVVLVRGAALEETEEAVRAIEAEWKKRFAQESVLRVDAPVRGSFD